MKPVKRSICDLEEYRVPQDSSLLKLNQNESPYDVPEDLKMEVFERLRGMRWNRYPAAAAESLVEQIACYTHHPANGIMVANASNEIIQTVIYSACDSGDRVVTITPGFSVYHRVASVMNIENIAVPLNDDFSFDIEGLIAAAKTARLVIVASPNNPTGTALPVERIADILAQIGCLLAVDEAYFEFSQKTAQHLLADHPNLVIIRTFSKALRLAGARLGYLLGAPQVVVELQKARLPFSLGIFQQIAGEILLKNQASLRSAIDGIIQEREKVFKALSASQVLEPIPSLTNFILFKVLRNSARELFAALYKRGVVLRSFSGTRLDDKLRVTIGTPEQNLIFVNTLNEVLKQWQR